MFYISPSVSSNFSKSCCCFGCSLHLAITECYILAMATAFAFTDCSCIFDYFLIASQAPSCPRSHNELALLWAISLSSTSSTCHHVSLASPTQEPLIGSCLSRSRYAAVTSSPSPVTSWYDYRSCSIHLKQPLRWSHSHSMSSGSKHLVSFGFIVS